MPAWRTSLFGVFGVLDVLDLFGVFGVVGASGIGAGLACVLFCKCG